MRISCLLIETEIILGQLKMCSQPEKRIKLLVEIEAYLFVMTYIMRYWRNHCIDLQRNRRFLLFYLPLLTFFKWYFHVLLCLKSSLFPKNFLIYKNSSLYGNSLNRGLIKSRRIFAMTFFSAGFNSFKMSWFRSFKNWFTPWLSVLSK